MWMYSVASMQALHKNVFLDRYIFGTWLNKMQAAWCNASRNFIFTDNVLEEKEEVKNYVKT